MWQSKREISRECNDNWFRERITNKRKLLRRSGDGENGRYLPWRKEEEAAYIFWMKQVPVSPSFDLARNTQSQPSIKRHFAYLHAIQSNVCLCPRVFWGIRAIIRKPHIICAVILVKPCFIQVHDIIPCFPKKFDLSQIITPIIDNRHLVVQNSSIITYIFISISKINES